jgi:hypothetical protein
MNYLTAIESWDTSIGRSPSVRSRRGRSRRHYDLAFPELNPIAPEGQPASDIVSIFSALLPALIDQARFKPSEIILAANPKHGSRYLIGPSRVTSDGKEQRYGIASGLLGGFGGFVARSFRDHDFQLGPPQLPTFSADNIRASGRQQDH